MEGFLLYRLPILACTGVLFTMCMGTWVLAQHLVQKFRAHAAAKPVHAHAAARG